MKILQLSLALCLFVFSKPVQAQTVDQILTTYIENIGGQEKLRMLQGLRMTASVNQRGTEIPFQIVQLKDGRQMTIIQFHGNELKQRVFDGETLWGHNFITLEPEKSDAETTQNFKLRSNDFPIVFLDYKQKGYTVELLGKAVVHGNEAFKIKLVKEPLTIDGKEEEDVSFYFFDAVRFFPVAIHSEIMYGKEKGQMQEVVMSDYQEVEGLYFPFFLIQGMVGEPGNLLTIERIELNPEVADDAFSFPGD
ncbi:outer membrane lipoprotein-sorting protein [Flavobacteriaceae bacterium 3-367]|uniref:outer membrane lipoprotein-sorting protein n=1 Tax=Eudoraea algarum TaxID=3417568 RepID=UPI00327F2F6E